MTDAPFMKIFAMQLCPHCRKTVKKGRFPPFLNLLFFAINSILFGQKHVLFFLAKELKSKNKLLRATKLSQSGQAQLVSTAECCTNRWTNNNDCSHEIFHFIIIYQGVSQRMAVQNYCGNGTMQRVSGSF